MEVVLQLRFDIAQELQKSQATLAETQNLVKVADELNVVLEPLHSGVEDPKLASFFAVKALDMQTAERIRQRLEACEGVGSAYVKPQGEPP